MGNYHIKVYPTNIERRYNNRKVRPVSDIEQISNSDYTIDSYRDKYIPMFIYDKSEISLYKSNKN